MEKLYSVRYWDLVEECEKTKEITFEQLILNFGQISIADTAYILLNNEREKRGLYSVPYSEFTRT